MSRLICSPTAILDVDESYVVKETIVGIVCQSELPRPIPRNSVESEHRCTSWIYFDNTGDNMMLTLYIVMLTSQKPC